MEEGDINWHKIWLGNLTPLLRGLSGNTQDLFWYLVDNMDKENNVKETQKQIAKKMKTVQPKISEALNELEYRGLIVCGYGFYMINPEVIYKGGNNKRKLSSAEYERLSTQKGR